VSKLRLGNVCSKIGSGATPRGGSDVYLTEGVSLIRSQNVYNDRFAPEGLAFIGEQHADQLSNVEVRAGDVLLNITGDSVARACRAPADVLPARVNQHVAIIRPDEKVLDARYLHYFLVSPHKQASMLTLAGGGATRKALTKGMIEDFQVPDPGIDEQRAMASVLGALDDKIEQNRRTAGKLEELARAVFKAWFVNFEPVHAKANGATTFPGLPQAAFDALPTTFQDSPLGPIPEGWEAGSISDICTRITSGGTPKTTVEEYWKGDLPWLSSGETREPYILDTEKSITRIGVEESSTRLVRKGSTVIASAGQGKTRGQTSLLFLDCYINQSVLALESNERSSDALVFLSLRPQYEELRRISDSHSSRGSLTKSLVGAMPITIPSQSVVDSFDLIVGPMFDLIRSSLIDNRKLAELRDYLLPRLLSGSIRVRIGE